MQGNGSRERETAKNCIPSSTLPLFSNNAHTMLLVSRAFFISFLSTVGLNFPITVCTVKTLSASALVLHLTAIGR